MKSNLLVPVDKEMKYESTSPPLSMDCLERLLVGVLVFRNVERERHETLCKGKGCQRNVHPWIGRG
jgi:hypothetical protein